jgi:nitrite reductase (NO-forming)
VEVRQRNRWYQAAALGYLTGAILALLLPPADRLGLWMPLHLAVAGAIGVAISGAMQVFARTLTATAEPPAGPAWVQLGLVVAGAACIAIGLPTETRWLTAVGGASWTAGIALLGWLVWRAWSTSLSRRHPMPMAAYGLAVTFALIGGFIGAMLGRGGLAPATYVMLRRIHPTVNVLGFASLTIVGTMVTLLPTVLRVRMVPWRGWSVLALLATGVATQALGWAVGSAWVVGTGGLVEAAGAVAFAVLVIRTVRTARRWAVPTAAFHFVSGVAWFVLGSVWYASRLVQGATAVEGFRQTFLAVFVWGWLVQVLLGAWSYLLPMMRPGSPTEHRAGLQVFEVAGRTQVVVLDLGVALLAARASGWLPPAWGKVGWALALAGTIVAVTKTWLFPVLAAAIRPGVRPRSVWGS